MKLEELARLLQVPELPAHVAAAEKAIEHTIAIDNPTLYEASLRLVQAGGKRLRPFFVIAAASSQGGKVDDNVIAGCVAVELAHIGTLVHDDVIDEAQVRRGAPTVNAKEGVNSAILVGDYLLALASAEAVGVNKEVARIVASTVAEMCDGQSQETTDKYNIERSIDSYLAVIYKKTAALTSAACRIGAICAGLPSKQIEALAAYGKAFGMAFQLADDLLDFISTSEAMGKPVGNDVKEGVYTLPLLLALEDERGDTVRSLLKKDHTKSSQKKLVEILGGIGAFEETLKEIKKYNDEAEASLLELGQTNVVKGLAKLPGAYLEWALQRQVVLSR